MRRGILARTGCGDRQRASWGGSGGFTIVELLIVMAVIIILLSILLTVLSLASKSAQKANTQTLMTSMQQALVRFKEDLGYYPPVLGPDEWDAPVHLDEYRALKPPPNPTDPAFDEHDGLLQGWYSYTTLAEYLLGYAPACDLTPTPYLMEDGADGLGFRDPSPDGVWGATLDFDGARDACDRQGKVYGPYLELKDERLLGAITSWDDVTGRPIVSFPGEGGYTDDAPKVICDYWGRPIRYYRQMYPEGALGSPVRAYDPATGAPLPSPTLADVILLRPFNIRPGAETDVSSDGTANTDFADARGDTSATYKLRTAEIGLFSPGPDQAFDAERRRDDDEFNRDNIVEVGP